MFKRKECVAMLLAGGQGSRLYTLTEKTAKPAVPFGGKYRIIDFPLSNCVNSGIDTVGVLTQYQPLVLNEYIGNGQPWDLDRSSGGVMVLPPYQAKDGAAWYKGTANAIYQNLNFIERYDPEYVLILSGDHIYKMDYSAMIAYHKEKGADCTIAVFDVPITEASRFGIMNTDDTGRIVEFEEKPRQPKSTHASMGIYLFNAKLLTEYLVRDEADSASSNDFGKNIIPTMLAEGKRMYAYAFSGYWKDVGTIKSLWDANMDLLGEYPTYDLYDRHFRIYSRTPALPPQYIGEESVVHNAIISEGNDICGTVENSVLFSGVTVEAGAVVRNSVVMSGCTVKSGATVSYAILDEDVVIDSGAIVGAIAAEGEEQEIAVVGNGVHIRAGDIVAMGEMLGAAEYAKKQGGNEV
ncbi:MAG: glucose-1-phosphate adenylyltransferase [Clostridia bacterium]|nr:glucose-1-phosphate adenylyltransferase [Clostridia bacterium]